MHSQPVNHDAILRAAQMNRARSFSQIWTRLVDLLSPRLPRIFPSEY